MAIIHQSKRNATVVCDTDVSVLAIERDDFVDIFMHVETGQEPEHISFLRNVETFTQWPIEKLPYYSPKICLLTFFRKNALMCANSAQNDWIFIVKHGSCRILKCVTTVSDKNPIFQMPDLTEYKNFGRCFISNVYNQI